MARKRIGRNSANPKPKRSEEDQKSNSLIRNHKFPILGSSATTIVPSSLKDVLLDDWWLVKAGDGEGEGLAVGGFTLRERVGLRAICSAEISERHEATVVKAKDGITFTISGFINRSRTMENGFPPEVCSRFLLGFPFDWKNYVSFYLGSPKQEIKTRISDSESNVSSGNSCQDLAYLPATKVCSRFLHGFPFDWKNYVTFYHGSPKQGIKTRISDSESNVSSGSSCQDLAYLPVTRVRDLLLSTHGDSCYSLLMDTLHQDLASEKSRSCGGVSTRSMTRLENKKTDSANSNNGQRLEEHALPPEKTMMKTRSVLTLGFASEARISKKKPDSTTDTARRTRSRSKRNNT